MEYHIRNACPEDVPDILAIVRQSVAALEHCGHGDWFVADDEAYLNAHLDGEQGFCLVAADMAGTVAAYFTVKFAGTAPDALGRMLGMGDAALRRTAQMDSCCVAPAHRGHSLEGRLIETAEARLSRTGGFDTLLATVHPDNAASLQSGLHRGYRVAATVRCYGGKVRYLLQKSLSAAQNQ